MDLQQIWDLAQRLIDEGRARHEVEDRVKELTLQATGISMSISQLERQVLAPGEGAARQTLRALLAVPGVVRAAPKLVVRALQESFNLPEHVVNYLADNEPKEVAADLAKGVGAAADFIAEDVGEYGPGAILEGVGPIARVGKVDDAVSAIRQLKRGVEPGDFAEGIEGGAHRIFREGKGAIDSDAMAVALRKETFKQVDNPDDAFWLLADGRMFGKPERTMFGHDIEFLTDALGEDPRSLGTIRMVSGESRIGAPWHLNLDMNHPPTDAQKRVIRRIVKDKGGDIDTYVDTPGGSFKIEAAQSRQVLNEINREMDTIFEAPGVPRGPDPVPEDPIVKLNRFTREEDPFSRTGISAQETRRRLNDPEGFEDRLNFNVAGTGDPEQAVGALPFRTDFEIPKSRLYDLREDPLGIVAEMQRQTVTGPQDFNAMERRIKDAGFLGYLERKAPGQRGAQRAVVFEDRVGELKQTRFGPSRGPGQDPPGEVVGRIDPEMRARHEQEDLVRQRVAGGRAEDTPFNVVDLTNEFGGSTVDPRNGRSLVGEDRWASSIGPKFEETYDKALDHTTVERFIRKHQQYLDDNPDVMVGTWYDEENRKWEINLTRLFDKQRDARNYAASNKQRAIMNLADPEFEAVKTGDAFANSRLRMRLDNQVASREIARLENFRAALDDEELQVWNKMSQDLKQRTLDHYSLMSETEDGAALALVGAEAARWYQESAKPLFEMFGTDAPRFLAVTAGMSPNAPVDKAFYAGLEFWADWNQAGRPKSREFVEQALDRLKTKWGVTPTNANNLERILLMDDADFLKPGVMERGGIFGVQPRGAGLGQKSATGFLSGHKIDPFWGNLNQYLQRWTMDTHMKSVAGTVTQASASKAQVLGSTARGRDYARFLTEATGQPWSAAEVQAAQWAVVKNMKEMALEGVAVRSRGGQTKKLPKMLKELTGIPEGLQWTDDVPATGFGELSERIRNSPSLARFLHTDEAAPILGRLGMEPPPLVENMSKLGFLDDPNVRFGDVMESMIRIAQTNGQSLGGLIAMLVGQGVMNQVQGAELIDALGAAAGFENVSEAAKLDPAGVSDIMNLQEEVGELNDEQIELLGQARGIEDVNRIVKMLRPQSQEMIEAKPGEREDVAGLQDTLKMIAGGGSFRESRLPDLVDFLMPKERGVQTAGMVLDLPFLGGIAQLDPEFSGNRDIVTHEGAHALANLQPEETQGIRDAIDVFIGGLDSDRRANLGGMVANREANDEALQQELFAELFREELLTPDAPPSMEGTEGVRQLMRQLVDRRLNFPGIGD